MLILCRYPGVPNFLIHERVSCFDRLTAILTILPFFQYQKWVVFGLFIKPPFSEHILIVTHLGRNHYGHPSWMGKTSNPQ